MCDSHLQYCHPLTADNQNLNFLDKNYQISYLLIAKIVETIYLKIMKREILLLRISYWSAAIADFSIAILVLIPERMGLTEIVYPMGLMSAIAFSWGVLLLIADRKPLQRRWILIPTIIVVALLSIARIIFALTETIEFSLSFSLLGIILIILMVYSYYSANRIDNNN